MAGGLAADLGMFSMFGRTGPPAQKGGPTKGAANFFACPKYRNNGMMGKKRSPVFFRRTDS